VIPLPAEVVVAVISGLGTLLGSMIGVIASNKLVQYRLQELEKKVEAHNKLDSRLRDLDARFGQLELIVKMHHKNDE